MTRRAGASGAGARVVYPRYGFAAMDGEDYGKRLPLR